MSCHRLISHVRVCVFVLLCSTGSFADTAAAADLTARTFEILAKRTSCPGGLPASAHPYGNSLDARWTNSCPGARALEITFDSRSQLEWLYDYVYVTDASGTNVRGSPFTGSELAGKTLIVPGDTVIVRLDTDGAISEWGFAVSTLVGLEPQPSPQEVTRTPLTLVWQVEYDDLQGDINHWFDAVYIANEPLWSTNAIPVAYSSPSEPLQASGTYFQWATIETPAMLDGIYYLIVRVDNADFVQEVLEANNELAAPLRIKNADLAVITFNAPTTAAPQQPITVNWTVTNLSSDAALPYWYDYVYWRQGSRSNVVDLIFRDAPLPPGGSYDVTREFTLPPLAAGTHRLETHGNAWGLIESNRQNNVLGVSISITTPDLVALTASAPSVVSAGEWFAASLVVSNAGPVTAYPSWYDAAYISSSNGWTTQALWVAEVGWPVAIAPGILYTQQFQLNLPSAQLGDVFLLLRADVQTNLFDANPNNNVLAIPLHVKAADLAPIAFEAGPSLVVAPNQPLAFTWTVKNSGSAPANRGWFDRILLATDSSASNVIAEIASFWHEAELAPLTSYSQAVTRPIVPAPAGDYFLILQTDGHNYQPEANEDDNIAAIPVTISAADLAIDSLIAPASIAAQQPFSVSWTVRNLGPSTAYPSWDDTLYLAALSDFFQPLDYLVRLSSSEPLAPGATYTQTQVFPQAPSWPAGDFSLVLNTAYPLLPPEIEGNDVAAVPIRVEGADLMALEITAPGPGLLQSSGEVSLLVSNAGPVIATAPWVVHFYISETNEWPETATYVGSAHVTTSLAPQTSISVTALLQFRGHLPGMRFLIGYVDNIRVSDPNPANNAILQPITIRGADLAPELFGVLEAYGSCPGPFTESPHPYPETYVSVTTHVCPGANALKLVFDSRSDTGLDTIEIMDGARQPIAGSPFTGSELAATPVLVAGDSVILQFAANHGSTAWGFALTDLVALRAATNTVAAAQQTLDFQWVIRNHGDGPTILEWSDAVGLLATRGFPNIYSLANLVQPKPLVAGDSYRQQIAASLPPVKPGRYEVILHADGQYAIEEASEDNNTRSIFVQIVSPDVAVAGLQAPASLDGQSTFQIVWRVQNVGAVVAFPAWMDRLYVSPTNRITSSALEIWWEPHYTTLTTNSSYTVTQFVTLPPLSAGNYYIIARTDADSTLFDSFPDNNEFAVPINIKAPDLAATHFAAVPPGALQAIPPQSTVGLSYTVQNLGPGVAISGWYDEIYFSRDGLVDDQDVALLEGLAGQGPLSVGASYTRTVNVRVPGFSAGEYFLVFQANSGGSLAEARATNNTLVIPISLAAVDLQLTAFTASNEAAPKQAISIAWSVKNNGPAVATAAWHDSFYLSITPVWNANALLVSNFWRNETLISGGTYTASASIIVPDLAPGDYYVVARADGGAHFADSDPVNNFRAVPLRIVLCDLSPVSLIGLHTNGSCPGSLPELPSPVPRGAVLRWTNSCPGASNLQVTFDADSYISYNSSFLTVMDKNGTPIPGSPFTGWIYPLRQLVPGDETIIELSTGPYGSDRFRITDISSVIETTNLFASPQGEIDIQWSVANSGFGVASPQWADQFYVSSDPSLDMSDILLSADYVSQAVDPGALYRRNTTLQVGAFTPGQYYLLLEADGQHDHSEMNETNNVLAVPLTIGEPADLAPVWLEAPALVNATQRFAAVSVKWTVTNQGAAVAGTYWSDDIYISRDQQFDPEDTLLASFSRLSALAPGHSYTTTQSVTLPGIDGGQYYLILVVDGQSACQEGCVYEKYETNNVISAPIQLNLVLPDLLVTQLDAPPLIASSQDYPSVELGWIVRNEGPGAIAGSWTDNLYINGGHVFSVFKEGPLLPGASYTNRFTEYLSLASGGNYSVTVRVDDADYCNCVPELSESNNSRGATFRFVRSPREIVFAGEASRMPLFLNTPLPLATVDLDLLVQPTRLANLAASYSVPFVSQLTTVPFGNGRYHLRWETFVGEHFVGRHEISQLHFQALPNQSSCFVPIVVSNILARSGDGSLVPGVSVDAGRVIVLGPEPLIEITPLLPAEHLLTIYGFPGCKVFLESKITFSSGRWVEFWAETLTNRFHHAGPYPTHNDIRFYRTRY